MADSYEVDVAGQEFLIKCLTGATFMAPNVLGQALYEEGQMAFRQTQKEVPVRKGYLKNSGRLDTPAFEGGGNVVVTITYGSAAAKYAAAVHDIDKNYRNGRKWHYVADPVNARVQGMEGRLLKRMDRIIGRT